MRLDHQRQSSQLWKHFAACPLLICLFAGCGDLGSEFNPFSSGTAAALQEPETAKAFRGEFDLIVLAQGEVESSNNAEVVCKVETEERAGIPILWLIEEGTFVEKGEKLVELDGSIIEEQLKNQGILVANATATVIRSRADVETAEISLRQYLEGTYVSERKTLLSQIALAEQALRTAELNLENSKALEQKGLITELQTETDEYGVKNAQMQVELMQTQLTTLDKLVREKNRITLESNIEASKAKLQSDQLVLREQEAEEERLRLQLGKCSLQAPSAGVVTYAHTRDRRGQVTIEEGTSVRERQAIIKLPDPTQMRVKATVNESRVLLVSAGQSAMVRVDGVKETMAARVDHVNRFAEAGNWYDSAVKNYAVLIEIEEPSDAIRTGMTAEVRIVAEHETDALKIPVESVYEHQNRLFCLKKETSGEWSTIEVQIAGSDGAYISVTEGLVEGDEVAINPRTRLDLLKFAMIEEVTDRDELLRIGEEAGKK